ncbi:MAG TPA: hypothetical protein VFX60_00740, partial [Micromonospora sp.]|nr:hypothetical protein [Micromonospora sp.]
MPILGDDMQTPPPAPAVPEAEVRGRLTDLTYRDQRRIQRRLEGVRKIRDAGKRDAALAEIATEVATAEQRLAARRAAVP